MRRTEAHGARELGLEPGSSLLFERLQVELARVSALIEKRRRSGKVRRGHGDLHLRNICLYEGKALAFDALEFDDQLATTDVLYDLAFLLMDLRRARLDDHANAAMNRYWDVVGEEELALGLLPFFTALRAAVRMAVAVEVGALEEAQTYRALGIGLLAKEAPRLVAIGGLSGSGKTALAQALAPRLPGPAGARLLRSDVLRKRKRGRPFDERAGAAYYAPERRADVYRELCSRAADATHAGANVIADATFQLSSTRASIEAAAGPAAFRAYWLDAPVSVRLARVSARTGDASDADAAVAAAQLEPTDLSTSWRRLDANRPLSENVNVIAADLP